MLTSNSLQGQGLPQNFGMELEVPSIYYLELIVNGRRTGRIVKVSGLGDDFTVSRNDLESAGIDSEIFSTDQVVVTQVPEIDVGYQAALQRLTLRVPTSWLPHQNIDYSNSAMYSGTRASLGSAFNYDVYTSSAENGSSAFSAQNEFRVFGNFGAVRSNGVYRHIDNPTVKTVNEYIHFDTTWRLTDQDKILIYEAGDVISNGPAWARPVRMGGFQLSRQFDVRPDIITYPLPDLIGDAEVPTTVDVLVNGYSAGSKEVQPGPFTLIDIPFVNGAGQATLVSTDALGRRIATTSSFYVTPQLLREDLLEYNFSVGALRRNYGTENFSYGDAATTASIRYGISDILTLESHLESTNNFLLGGVATLVGLSNFGVLNLGYSQSQINGERGHQQIIGYEYSSQYYSFGAQHIRSNDTFRDLSGYQRLDNSVRQQTSQLYSSFRLGAYGNISAGYFDIETSDDDRTRLLNVSWSRPQKNLNFLVSAHREIGEDWSLSMQLTWRFDNNASASFNVSKDPYNGRNSAQSYNRSAPIEGGWGWNLTHRQFENQQNSPQASATWKGDSVEVRGGVWGSNDQRMRWGSVKGGLAWMNGKVFATNKISNSFVLVSTNGQGDVPVSYENQFVGSTDKNGYFLVPWGTSYYPAHYSINTLALPSNVTSDFVDQRVAVQPGAGYLLEFPVIRALAASIQLVDTNGAVIPLGSRVSLANGESSVVGFDGLVYFPDVDSEQNRLTVTFADGSRCQAEFFAEADSGRIESIGPILCQ